MRPRRRGVVRSISRDRAAVVGLALVGLLVLFAILGPPLLPHDPYVSDFIGGATDTQQPIGPSTTYWLGTDRIFRDNLARLAVGARLSLTVAVVATVLASGLGTLVGVVAGWLEGTLVDRALMRLVDVGLAFPFLLLIMAIGSALERTSASTIFLTLGLTGWLGTARLVRAKTMQLRSLDFVLAAKALGQSTAGILLRHILPNVAGPVLVVSTVSVAQMILAESVLSYLGAGLPPPTPTWGHMLFEGQDVFGSAPWIALGPAFFILVAVLGFNLLGEGLRDALDPHAD